MMVWHVRMATMTMMIKRVDRSRRDRRIDIGTHVIAIYHRYLY